MIHRVKEPFPQPIVQAKLLRRYKRFLADMRFPDGDTVTAHCPNTGSMKASLETNAPCLLFKSDSKTRKYPYGWLAIRIRHTWVGIDTQLPNRLVKRMVQEEAFPGLEGSWSIQREPRLSSKSRADLKLSRENQTVYIEVKNVTLVEEQHARFPDAVSERAKKHIRELLDMLKQGHRAMLVFIIQRDDARSFSAAWDIDPDYGETLRNAASQGLEILAIRCRVDETGVETQDTVPVILSPPGK